MKRKENKEKGFNILLGITGGIAAYKCCELVRLFVKDGHDVKVILTRHAKKFVTPLTLETLSGNPVYTDLFKKGSFSTEHINLSKWGDVLLVAPATANIIGKFAAGIADDLLSTMLLAFKDPIVISPSMHSEMWDNMIVQQNIEKLKGLGIHIVPPEEGELASGDTGKGRLPDPKCIMDHTLSIMTKKKDLEGKKILITAGPTQEYIDPVRYISSPSSGKMGIALAKEAHSRGAKVTLIHGPIKTDGKFSWKTIPVTSAAEMNRAVQKSKDCDIFISSAAVGDFSPVKAPQKIKKNGSHLELNLKPNPDILENFSKNHGKDKIVVGFAAETSDTEKNAYQKLKQKRLDLIIANDVTLKDSGFGSEFNAVSIIDKKGHSEKLPLQEKSGIAKIIFDRIKRIHK